MTRDAWVRAFEQAPEAVQAYLLDPATAERERVVQESLGYEHDAWDRVMDVVWEVLFAHISPEDASARFATVAGDRSPKDVEKKVLMGLILPLADAVLWDVEARLQQLGVSAAEYATVPRVSLRPLSYGAAIRRIAGQAKIGLLSDVIAQRLRDGFLSFVKGIRTEQQFREVLVKGQSDGGIGLSQDQAEAFLRAMQQLLQTVRVLSEQEYAQWYATYQDQVRAQAEAAMESVSANASEEEVLRPTGPKHGLATLQSAIDATMTALASTLTDPFLQRRLETLVSTRLRDVRNASQVRQMLTREVKVGGLGLDEAQAETIVNVIEKAYEEHRHFITAEETQRIQSVTEQQKQIIEDRRKRDSEEHAKWYQEKVKGTQSAEAQAAAIFAAMKQGMQKGATPGAAPTSSLAMDAVRAPQRLMGLTDELAGISVAEFRRLAKNPADAAERIWQKLKTLESESFDRWTEGIQAWRNSPMQAEYLRLVAESFGAGKPVAQLVEERHASNPATLSPEEVNAMIQLNSRIQL